MKTIDRYSHQTLTGLGFPYSICAKILPMLYGRSTASELYDFVVVEISRGALHVLYNPTCGDILEHLVVGVAWANPEQAHKWLEAITRPIVGQERQPHYQPGDVLPILVGMFKVMVSFDRGIANYVGWEKLEIFRSFPKLMTEIITTQLSHGKSSSSPEEPSVFRNLTVELLWTSAFKDEAGLGNLLKEYTRLKHVTEPKHRVRLHGNCSGPNELFSLLGHEVSLARKHYEALPSYRDRQMQPLMSKVGSQFLQALDFACQSNLPIPERYAMRLA